jgi:hypothetical protein
MKNYKENLFLAAKNTILRDFEVSIKDQAGYSFENFEEWIINKEKTAKDIAQKSLNTERQKYKNDTNLQQKITDSIREMEDITTKWKTVILEEHNKEKEKRHKNEIENTLIHVANLQTILYMKSMYSSIDFDQLNFESVLNEKHQSEKEKALKSYNESQKPKDEIIDARVQKFFDNQIEIFFEVKVLFFS